VIKFVLLTPQKSGDIAKDRHNLIPELQARNRLSKISRSVPEDLPACDEIDGFNQRHLVTFVTPSMETIPLEMCQDIPDVLI
jgi:hypothetical protein